MRCLAHFGLLASSLLLSIHAFKVELEIWVTERARATTYLYLPQINSDEPDLLHLDAPPSGDDKSWRMVDGVKWDQCRLHTEYFTELVAYRPLTIVQTGLERNLTTNVSSSSPPRGDLCAEQDKCEISIWQEPSSAIQDDELKIIWNLGWGYNQDFAPMMGITCWGPKEGLATLRGEDYDEALGV